ncbi:hypothetical protein CKY51_13400 [Xanthomonas maliensis]|nr:hypothetical protein CKY51_13400 [Xanthomonas maliensis]
MVLIVVVVVDGLAGVVDGASDTVAPGAFWVDVPDRPLLASVCLPVLAGVADTVASGLALAFAALLPGFKAVLAFGTAAIVTLPSMAIRLARIPRSASTGNASSIFMNCQAGGSEIPRPAISVRSACNDLLAISMGISLMALPSRKIRIFTAALLV